MILVNFSPGRIRVTIPKSSGNLYPVVIKHGLSGAGGGRHVRSRD